MAAPSTVTTLNASGTYSLNRAESDFSAFAGIEHPIADRLRAAFGHGETITLVVKQYTDETGIEQLETILSLPGGKTIDHKGTLDGAETTKDHPHFGASRHVMTRTNPAGLTIASFQAGWAADTVENGVIYEVTKADGEKNDKHWVLEQVLGFAEVNGVRKIVRRVNITTEKFGSKDIQAVYDYVSA